MGGVCMAIYYNKLWSMLAIRGMNKTDLKHAIGCSQDTITALSKNNYVNLRTIDKICDYFNCEVEDVLEHRKTEKTV